MVWVVADGVAVAGSKPSISHRRLLSIGTTIATFNYSRSQLLRDRFCCCSYYYSSKKNLQVKAMRAVVQRVSSASVEVEGRIVSEIGAGLLVLIGIHDSDTDSDADYICRKLLNMRLFTNEATGRAWDQHVMQKNYGVLLVSQFTLYGFLKGNKPDFHVAMPPQRAKPFYEALVDKFRKSYKPELVKDGIFGAMMKVNLVNDGPVTMQLESPQTSKSKNDPEESQATVDAP